MTQGYWAIRMFVPFDELTTINFVGSFDHIGKRYLDDLVIFNGMYGIPGFLLWYIHKDLVTYNFSSYSFELELYTDGNMDHDYFTERYRVIDVRDDFDSDRKLVVALREDDMMLNSPLINADIGTLDFSETRTVEQLLFDVLEKTNIIPVVFDEHDDPEKKSIKFEYSKFTLDPIWLVRDFIVYIANENNFEWAIKDGFVFIGPELHAYEELKATRDWIDRSVDNIGKNYFTMKIGFSNTPLDILYKYDLEQDNKVTGMRCIWTKHYVGSKGDTTKGCFVPIGHKIDKEQYFYTLEGNMEKSLALRYLFKDVKCFPIIIGRITNDSGNNQYADNISIEKDVFNYTKKTPRNIPINIRTQIYNLPQIGRTTPYLDENAGLFFPVAKNLQNNPNRIIFNPYNRIEQAVLGPFVMGNGSPGFIIPAKDPDALRWQLPSGWCLYVDADGKTILQPKDTVVITEPIENESVMQVVLDPTDNSIVIRTGATNYIKIDSSGNIEIKGTTVKFQGGGNKLSHGDHVHGYNHQHTTGNMGMPVPFKPTVDHIGPGQNTDQHLVVQGTTTTEAE